MRFSRLFVLSLVFTGSSLSAQAQYTSRSPVSAETAAKKTEKTLRRQPKQIRTPARALLPRRRPQNRSSSRLSRCSARGRSLPLCLKRRGTMNCPLLTLWKNRSRPHRDPRRGPTCLRLRRPKGKSGFTWLTLLMKIRPDIKCLAVGKSFYKIKQILL